MEWDLKLVMHRLSIKRKLLIYNFFIQILVLIIFSVSLYKALDISTVDKIHSTLKVILLDVVDDVIEQKEDLSLIHFNEENEYKYKPLYIRLIEVSDTVNQLSGLEFPAEISTTVLMAKSLKKDTIIFYEQDKYIISRIKIDIDKKEYIVEIATDKKILDKTLENLLYILFFITPIIIVLSTLGGYFLIYKSFLPIEGILEQLKNINATDLSKRLFRSKNRDEIDLLKKEINSLIARLESSFEKISQFSSDASHEFKTPLTIIRGEIEVGLRKDRTTLEYKEILTSNLNEVLTIQQTVADLLFLAKSEQYLSVITKEDVFIDEVLAESMKELESFSKLHDITLKYDLKGSFLTKGNSALLKIALKNIVKNAIVFSHRGSYVQSRVYKVDKNIVISIEDKGIGIAKDEQKKIFENFYRTDKSRNKNLGGTGLGMSICNKIVKSHQGSIEIISEENVGTKVLVYIPIA